MSSWWETARYAQTRHEELRGTAEVLVSAVAGPLAAGDWRKISGVLNTIGKTRSLTFARVSDSSGVTSAEIGTAVALGESSDASPLWRPRLEVRLPVEQSERRLGFLTLQFDTSDLWKRLIPGLLGGMLAATVTAGLGLALVTHLQRSVARPLRQLTETMVEIQTTRDFRRKVDVASDDEIGQLAGVLNDLMAQIRQRDERLRRQQAEAHKEIETLKRKLLDAKVGAQEAKTLKSNLLLTMGHEIRTPMNGMLVMAELLASADLGERHRRYADVIVRSGKSLLSIINDILDFSKMESGELKLERVEFDPAEVINDVLGLYWELAMSKGLDLACYLAPDVPDRIETDPVRLNQILSNLVNNALKSTESGYVGVSVRVASGDGESDEMTPEFCVSDTGSGVPEDKLGTLNTPVSESGPSTSRRSGGVGLGFGMSICKRLVDALGGRTYVTNNADAGTHFHFTVVTRGRSAPAPDESLPVVRPIWDAVLALSGRATARALKLYLSDRGIRATQIAPAEFDAARAARADLILADPDLIARLRPQSPDDGPFVVCVSQLGDVRSDQALRSGHAHDVLLRPVTRNAFWDLIDRLQADKPLGRAPSATRRDSELPRFTGLRALIADDSPVSREVVIEVLKQLDVGPEVVEDGRAAVAAARNRVFDMIFMDCSMPEMDGFEATRRIRAHEQATGRRRVPIVALTAHVEGSAADEWQRAGMDAYLTKPFRITDIADCFERFASDRTGIAVKQPSPDHVTARETTSDKAVAESGEGGAEEPVIDQTVLETIAGCGGGAGARLVERVFSLFEKNAPEALERLEDCLLTSTHEEIKEAAHALKSMGRTIGATRLSKACQALELEAGQGTMERADERLAAIRLALQETTACLSDHPDRKAPAA